MPLKAFINGNPVIAPLLSDDEWKTLNSNLKFGKNRLKFYCCDNTGHGRVSKLGTKHFVHNKKDNCNWKPESLEHLKLKAEILQICSQMGWFVDTEVTAEDWTADVMVWNNNRKIVFEVQLSYQTFQKTIERTARYSKNNCECYWLFKKLPTSSHYQNNSYSDVNCFKVSSDSKNNYNVDLYNLPRYYGEGNEELNYKKDMNDVTVPISEKVFSLKYGKSVKLNEFICGILNNTIKYNASIQGKNKAICYRIVFFPFTCWSCNKVSHVYYIDSIDFFESTCGIITYEHEDENSILFHPSIISLIRNFQLETEEGKGIILGEIKERYSRAMESQYKSFGCPYCDALFGAFYIHMAIVAVKTGEVKPTKVLPVNIVIENFLESDSCPHWCQITDNKFCDDLK